MKNLLWPAISLVGLLAASGPAIAQDQDPPSRVARIAYVTGTVSFQPASVDQWAEASLNYPMTTGDSLYTDNGSRTVLRIGQNSIRLDSGTNFQFVNLSDNVVQTSINTGSLNLHLRQLYNGESWEVDTPNGAVTLLRPGDYRIDTDASRNATMVTVRAGDIEVTAHYQSFPVHAGQSAYFDASGNAPDVQAAYQPDDFDGFAASRNRVEDVPPPQYVSPDMVGYEDLNTNGDWQNSPEYGPVWTPRVASGWTPYHDGHWAWVEPWGWSWVDDEPWGFAPFHYGRWAWVNSRWGWCPGVVARRAYYAPALVAFVGGGGFSASISIGGGGGGLVGWFPLGPREVYRPSYHVSPGYLREVNVTNTRITNINVTNINVTNINYANRNAMVAMPQNSFQSAQPVRRAAVRIDPNQMRRAQVIGTAPRVVPQRDSVLGAGGGRRVAAPPAAVANRAVIARLAPPPRAVPFAARQQLLRQHPGTPVAPAQLRTLNAQAARQNPAPGRMQIQPINTRQVRPVTPTVRSGPAPTLAQRAAEPRTRPGSPPNRQQESPSRPSARPQNLPQSRQQEQPPARPAPPTREQIQPPARSVPPAQQQIQPPARRVPPTREQIQPPARPVPPTREQIQPPARPVPPTREQIQPPARPVPPTREQIQPPAQRVPPTREQIQPPARPVPPAREQIQPPAHPAPRVRPETPPAARPIPPARPQQPPPVRPIPPVRPETQPQVRPIPPTREPAPPAPRSAAPAHPQSQPQHRVPPPPKKEERKPEERQQ